MCFSAPASFVSSAVLTAVGIATLWRAHSPRQLPLACVPLIFAVQQFSEGWVWVGLQCGHPTVYLTPATYSFLTFAQVVWPTWVPMSFLIMADPKRMRIALKILFGVGLLVSLYLAICLAHYGTFAEAHTRHVVYNLHYPRRTTVIVGALYGAVTIIPPFVAGIRHAWILGLAILVSYVITSILYEAEIISVWCYFSALMSVIVYGLVHHEHAREIDPGHNKPFWSFLHTWPLRRGGSRLQDAQRTDAVALNAS